MAYTSKGGPLRVNQQPGNSVLATVVLTNGLLSCFDSLTTITAFHHAYHRSTTTVVVVVESSSYNKKHRCARGGLLREQETTLSSRAQMGTGAWFLASSHPLFFLPLASCSEKADRHVQVRLLLIPPPPPTPLPHRQVFETRHIAESAWW